jgi:hypothetical protein
VRGPSADRDEAKAQAEGAGEGDGDVDVDAVCGSEEGGRLSSFLDTDSFKVGKASDVREKPGAEAIEAAEAAEGRGPALPKED